jgi:hypothetical protein
MPEFALTLFITLAKTTRATATPTIAFLEIFSSSPVRKSDIPFFIFGSSCLM